MAKCTTQHYPFRIRNDDDDDDDDDDDVIIIIIIIISPKMEAAIFPQNVSIYIQIYCHIPNILNVV
jgi:hypothetical protein